MGNKLFSNINRVEDRPAGYGEHDYEYLNTSARYEAADIRKMLEKAFGHYPEKEKKILKKKIQSLEVVHSKAAIFELLLHEIMVKKGYKVTIHPILRNSDKNPDFLIKKNQTRTLE